MKKKTMAMLISLVFILVCAVGGTLAWLTAQTDTVENTFTASDINIALTETWNTDSDDDGTNDCWTAQMIPGFTYAKDPKVTVQANSEDCYLFVKFEEKNDASTYLTYTSTLTTNNGWTQGDGTDIPETVWYREVTSSANDQVWELLTNNKVAVNGETVTKENMATAARAELVYTAYASQLYSSKGVKFSAKQAWENL